MIGAGLVVVLIVNPSLPEWLLNYQHLTAFHHVLPVLCSLTTSIRLFTRRCGYRSPFKLVAHVSSVFLGGNLKEKPILFLFIVLGGRHTRASDSWISSPPSWHPNWGSCFLTCLTDILRFLCLFYHSLVYYTISQAALWNSSNKNTCQVFPECEVNNAR